MNIHCFRHVPFEGLGCMSGWIKSPANKVTATKFYEDHRLPFVDICDLLVIMGGPMGVYDEKDYSWIVQEKKFIESAIKKGKKVIGICLGAQLIADVLGVKVYQNPEKEIGWHDVQFTEEALSSPVFKGFNKNETVFQWHGDTFDIPSGAIRIAGSKACPNQGFLYNNQVLALQFHLEITNEGIAELIYHCSDELLKPVSYIQTPEEINAKSAQYLNRSNELMRFLYTRISKEN